MNDLLRIHKKAKIEDDEDRISKLSDDVIHQIICRVDARLAVQTSVLSKRWKQVWTTLPLLNFNGYNKHYEEELSQFIHTKLIKHVVWIQVLSEILSDIVAHLHSPFYNLKYLKLPPGFDESSVPSAFRDYLLGGSPSATIVKPTPQANGHTIDVGEPKEDLRNSVVDSDKVRQAKAPFAVASNDRPSSSWGNSNLVFWRGHEVNSEFVDQLDLIAERYPETFELLSTKNKKIWTIKLNTLCSLVNAFTKTPKTEVDTEMLAEYRVLFTDLQRWGFNVNWLMSHLNHFEKLLLSKPLVHELHAVDSGNNDAKRKLHDLQTLRVGKMTNSGSSSTMGTSLAVKAGYIGDDIL